MLTLRVCCNQTHVSRNENTSGLSRQSGRTLDWGGRKGSHMPSKRLERYGDDPSSHALLVSSPQQCDPG